MTNREARFNGSSIVWNCHRRARFLYKSRCALYNPVELQQNVNKTIPHTSTSSSVKQYPNTGANIAFIKISK
jgi:hypothetical protein